MSKSPLTHISHDVFIKTILADLDAAKSFLNSFLPEHLRNVLDIESLTQVKTSFLTESLKNRFADVLFDIPLSGTQNNVRVDVLVELKSQRDRFVVFQLMEYLALSYRSQIKERRRHQRNLKLIIPFV